jgi:ADP-dependent NAD(P)H-hydrate dehydratase / NAD(P)H-hydrate epimerase
MTTSRGKILRILLLLSALGLIGAVVAALLLAKPFMLRTAHAQAREHGFELEVGQLDWGIGWVELRSTRFSLIGVSGIHGSADRIQIELSLLKPKRIRAEKVDVQVQGSIAIVAVEFSEWTKSYPSAYRLPAEAVGVAVSWRSSQAGAPWLAIRDGVIRPAKDGGLFQASDAKLAGFSLGRIGAGWTAEQSTIALGFGETEVERAPIRASIHHASDPPSGEIMLLQTELSKLADPFGVQIPLENVSASGEAKLVFQRGRADGVVDGSFKSRLHGYVPPHPRELDGFVFGDVTSFDSKFEISEDRTRATLTESTVTAGAFKLVGGGAILRHSDHATINLDLRGSLPCDSLASAAAESQLGQMLGSALGKLAGRAAKDLVGGSVAVRVKIDADSRDLPNAKVTRTIGIGCGLKPLKLDLDLGKLPPLPRGLPPLPSGLPPIPSGWPQLPSGLPPPPKFPLPVPDDDQKRK